MSGSLHGPRHTRSPLAGSADGVSGIGRADRVRHRPVRLLRPVDAARLRSGGDVGLDIDLRPSRQLQSAGAAAVHHDGLLRLSRRHHARSLLDRAAMVRAFAGRSGHRHHHRLGRICRRLRRLHGRCRGDGARGAAGTEEIRLRRQGLHRLRGGRRHHGDHDSALGADGGLRLHFRAIDRRAAFGRHSAGTAAGDHLQHHVVPALQD